MLIFWIKWKRKLPEETERELGVRRRWRSGKDQWHRDSSCSSSSSSLNCCWAFWCSFCVKWKMNFFLLVFCGIFRDLIRHKELSPGRRGLFEPESTDLKWLSQSNLNNCYVLDTVKSVPSWKSGPRFVFIYEIYHWTQILIASLRTPPLSFWSSFSRVLLFFFFFKK